MLRLTLAALAPIALTGCFDPTLRCALETPSGACLSVLSAVPSVNGVETPDVDVVQSKCGTAPNQTIEPFTDHNAVITILNAPPISLRDTPDLAPAVVINQFSIAFQVNTGNCGSGCPALDAVTGKETFTVLAGQQVATTFPMVPLNTKKAFIDNGGDASLVPSYSANYTLSGTDPQGKFTLTASTTFTLGNFNNCPQ